MMMYSFIVTLSLLSATAAFVPSKFEPSSRNTASFIPRNVGTSSETTEKRTGASYLPDETIERCKKGSPIEKAKMEKDATSAWVDVYEYARKIREGEMTWEEVEKADLDTVSRVPHLHISHEFVK